MIARVVDRQADDLHVPAVELGLCFGHVAELGRADRSEVLRVREEDAPRVAEPLVEADVALTRVGLEVWGHVAKLQCHLAVSLLERSSCCVRSIFART